MTLSHIHQTLSSLFQVTISILVTLNFLREIRDHLGFLAWLTLKVCVKLKVTEAFHVKEISTSNFMIKVVKCEDQDEQLIVMAYIEAQLDLHKNFQQGDYLK